MSLKQDSRYESYIKIERKCEDGGKKVEFNLLFSLKIEDIKNNEIIFYRINPLKVIDILKKSSQFFLIEKNSDKKNIYLIEVNDIKGDKIFAKIVSKIDFFDRRSFERFVLCPSDFGYFDVLANNKKICNKAYIEDISITGLKLYLPKKIEGLNFKELEISHLSNNIKIKIDIETVEIVKNHDHTLIRGKITGSNFNIANLITKKYIDISKKFLI